MYRDMPSIGSSTYASAAVNLNAFGNLNQQTFNQAGGVADAIRNAAVANALHNAVHPPKQEIKNMAARRLVQVFIADPNESVPLDQSLLYSGEQKLTDATDQELFFEIDIKRLLDKHNEKRAKIVDKKVKERTEYLEPAKIRDLKMVVVNVAGF